MTTTEHAAALDVRRVAGKPPLAQVPPLADVDAATGWLAAHLPLVRAEVLTSGCLMLRGLPVRTAADFARVRDVLLTRPATYKEKATPRSEVGAGVFSSTDLPAIQSIRLHNENSYTLDFPGTLVFGCLTAPGEGGATTVGDMRAALARVPAALRARFAAVGWLLERNYSDVAGLPWQRSYASDDPAVVEEYCRENLIGYEWRDGDTLRTRQRRSAVITHPVTGEAVWFNHVAFWNRWTLDEDVRAVLVETCGDDGLPFDTFLGDGTALTEAEAAALNRAYDEVTVRERWRPGDVLVVDNILCAHGRDAFRGDRSIVVGMGDPVHLRDCRPESEPAAGVMWR